MGSPATTCQHCCASRPVKYAVTYIYLSWNRNCFGVMCEECYEYIKNLPDIYRVVKLETL